MLTKRFSKAIKLSGDSFFASISEIVDGRTVVETKGAFFHLGRDMDHNYAPYQKLIDNCKDLRDTPVLLAFDGASKGNPGFAGCGFWLFSDDSKLLGEFSINLYKATNNEAEYSGLVFGLYCAKLAGKVLFTKACEN